MATAWILLAAHDGYATGIRASNEILQTGLIAWMLGSGLVIDIPLAHDAIVVAGRVGRTATKGISHPQIGDRSGSETRAQRRFGKMRRVAAVRFAAHIDHRGDAVLAQEGDEFLGGLITVADGEDARWLTKTAGIGWRRKWRRKRQLACTLSETSYRVWIPKRTVFLGLAA